MSIILELVVMAVVSSSTMPTRAPLLVCTTATSLEGMAFCQHALKNPGEFRVRALCRNDGSARARMLAKLGAEVVVADNLDQTGLEAAFEGAAGLYAITTWSGSTFRADGTVERAANLDAHHLEESEVQQGLNILRAAESMTCEFHSGRS